MSIAIFEDGRLRDAWTYEEYRSAFEEQASVESPDELPEDQQEFFEYYRLNFGRSKRVEENFEPSERLRRAVESIDEAQTWLVLTESWCGDSAQILPVLAATADLNEKISFRILLRDENLDIMDQYLTDGKRGIPKLIVFDAAGRELFTWGPRPQPAQQIFTDGESQERDRSDIYEEIQLWYNQDQGETVGAELSTKIEHVQDELDSHSHDDSETMNEETDRTKGIEKSEGTEQDEYERRVKAQIKEWERKIEELKKRIGRLQDNLKREVDRESTRYERELDSLRVKRDAAKQLLAELTGTSGKMWSGFQQELGDALEGAGEGLQRLADRLRKRKE